MRIYAWHNSILFVPSMSEDAAALLAKCIAMLYNSGRSVKYLEEMAQTIKYQRMPLIPSLGEITYRL
jgi:hypothetical protein